MIDNTKWSEIYNKHSKKMFWVCKRYVNDASLAEDLMHEGFIVAMQKQNTFSGFGSFEGWLRTIMVNTSLMYLRESKSNLFVSDFEISDTTIPTTEMNPTYDIKSKIINTDFSQQELLEVVEAIPEHHKIVFNMFVIDKFSHIEIGKVLNITTNTSKSHLLRARKKIQELLLLKANEKEQKKDRKKLFFWFLFTGSYIDSMYAKGFSSFEESPSNRFNINEVISKQDLPEKITSGYFLGITLQKVTLLSFTALLFATLFFMSFDKNNPHHSPAQITPNTELKNDRQGIKISEADSLQHQNDNNIPIEKNENVTNQANETGNVSENTNPITREPEKDKPDKKRPPQKNKNHVVIKRIIDTVYVYK